MTEVITPPNPVRIVASGREFLIGKIRLRHMEAVGKAMEPLFTSIVSSDGKIDVSGFVHHPESIIQALVSAEVGTIDTLGDLDIVDVMKLITTFIEENTDFFSLRLANRIKPAKTKSELQTS